MDQNGLRCRNSDTENCIDRLAFYQEHVDSKSISVFFANLRGETLGSGASRVSPIWEGSTTIVPKKINRTRKIQQWENYEFLDEIGLGNLVARSQPSQRRKQTRKRGAILDNGGRALKVLFQSLCVSRLVYIEDAIALGPLKISW